jgi:hypothetical protein
MVEKIDLRKELKYLYSPSANKVEIVDVPKFNFILLDGRIEAGVLPGDSPEFVDAMAALYGVAYTLKFTSKLREENPIDYTVMAAEGLWWLDSSDFEFTAREPLNWTLLMLQPEHITQEMYEEALLQLKKKKDNPALSRLRFEPFHEGLSVQIMHIGPYSEEPTTIAKMKAFAQENNLRYRGLHHEIYLGDPRRSKPEKLRTILRQPVERIE